MFYSRYHRWLIEVKTHANGPDASRSLTAAFCGWSEISYVTAWQAKNIPPQRIGHITKHFDFNVGIFNVLNWVILHKLRIIRKIFQASYKRSQRVQIFSVNVEFRTSYHRDNFMIHKSWICFQYFFFEFFMIAFDLNYGMTVKWFKRKPLIELDYILD